MTKTKLDSYQLDEVVSGVHVTWLQNICLQPGNTNKWSSTVSKKKLHLIWDQETDIIIKYIPHKI